MTEPLSDVEFRSRLERSRLLRLDLLDSASSDLPTVAGPPRHSSIFPERLLKDRLITPYQLRQLESGRATGFFLTDKYKILDFLGAGGMGKVFLCEHLLLQRLVAVKLLHLPESTDDLAQPATQNIAVIDRFYREARAVAALDHPNIVRVFDVDRVDSGPFMVMEFVDGATLHDLVVRHGPLSVARASHYACQAAAGLEHAHQAGLIHRDIKPANFILDRSGTVRMLDLGLACFSRDPMKNQSITAMYDQGALLGTVDFMSPEQATDSSKIDGRSDIYSLGSTLYFLLTGRVPFPNGSFIEKLHALQTQAPEPIRSLVPELPHELAAIVERMMEKGRDKRFATATEVVAALAPWTAEPIVPPSDREMPRTPASHYRLGLSGIPSALTSATAIIPNPMLQVQSQVAPSAAPTMAPRRTEPSSLPSTPVVAPIVPARRLWPIVIASVIALSTVVLAGLLVWLFTGNRNTPSPTNPQVAATEPKPTPAAEPKSGPFAGVILSGGGSTFVEPALRQWAEVYEKRQSVRIDYQPVGSSKGIQGVIDRVYRFGCSDAALTDEKMAKAGGPLVHIPLVMGAVVPTYNLPDVAEPLRFTGPILADIYLGKITRWNDPAIKIANPNAQLRDLPITVAHRSDGSGTTFIWTDFLSKASGEWQGKFGAKTELAWPVGREGKGNNGVATIVSRIVGSIGYVELSYALENNLRFGLVKNQEGKFIQANFDSVTAAAAASLSTIPDDLRYTLTDAPGEDSYPIAGTTWAILYVDQTDSKAGRELVDFLRWATHDGQAYVKDLRFVPLPPDLIKRIDDKLATIRISAK